MSIITCLLSTFHTAGSFPSDLWWRNAGLANFGVMYKLDVASHVVIGVAKGSVELFGMARSFLCEAGILRC